MPATRTSFWASKIGGNRARDAVARQRLSDMGWRTLCVWECALKGPGRLEEGELAGALTAFVTGSLTTEDIAGHPPAVPARPPGPGA
jgi:DNA mismatch endonuclease (patch repair protein)